MTYVLETNGIFKVNHIEDQRLMLTNLMKKIYFGYFTGIYVGKQYVIREKTIAFKQNTEMPNIGLINFDISFK